MIGQFKVSRAGYSLIEVIIALAIVLVMLVIFGGAISTIPLTKTARNQNVAYHIAAKKIEELRNTPFASLPGSGSFSDTALAELPGSTAALTAVNYQGSSIIKHFTVQVSWTENQTSRNVTLDTLIGEQGLSQP